MTEKKPLTLSGKTLELKKTLSLGGQVRQSVGGHKTNVVRVEVRKKRVITPTESNAPLSADATHKIQLLKEAQKVAEHARQQEMERQALLKKQREEQAAKEAAEKERAEKKAAAEAARISVAEQPTVEKKSEKKKPSFEDKKGFSEEEDRAFKKGFHNTERRNSGKINVNAYMGDEEDEDGNVKRGRSLASIRRAREKERLKHLESLKSNEKIVREVVIPETITVQELANRMSEKGATVVKTLMKMGMMVTITQTIDADTAELLWKNWTQSQTGGGIRY